MTKPTCLFLPLFLLLFGCGGEKNPLSNTKPNILLIIADDMGYGDLELTGFALLIFMPLPQTVLLHGWDS